MYMWLCSFIDNSGKRQAFKVKAKDKKDAIEKALKRARKNTCGDLLPHWTVTLAM